MQIQFREFFVYPNRLFAPTVPWWLLVLFSLSVFILNYLGHLDNLILSTVRKVTENMTLSMR